MCSVPLKMLVIPPHLLLVLVAASSAVATFNFPYIGLQAPIPIAPHLLYSSPQPNADFRGFSYYTRDLGGGRSEVVFVTGPDSQNQMKTEVNVMHDSENSLFPDASAQSVINLGSRLTLQEAASVEPTLSPEVDARPQEVSFNIEPLIATNAPPLDIESSTKVTEQEPKAPPEINNKNMDDETSSQEPSTTSQTSSTVPEQSTTAPEQTSTTPEQGVPDQPTTVPQKPSIVPPYPSIPTYHPSHVPAHPPHVPFHPTIFPAPHPFNRHEGSSSYFPQFPPTFGGSYGVPNFFRHRYNPYYNQYNPYINSYNPFFASRKQYHHPHHSPLYLQPAASNYVESREPFIIAGAPEAQVNIAARFDAVEHLKSDPQQFPNFMSILEKVGPAPEQIPAPSDQSIAQLKTSPEKSTAASEQLEAAQEQSSHIPEQPSSTSEQPLSEKSAEQTNPIEQSAKTVASSTMEAETADAMNSTTVAASEAVKMV